MHIFDHIHVVKSFLHFKIQYVKSILCCSLDCFTYHQLYCFAIIIISRFIQWLKAMLFSKETVTYARVFTHIYTCTNPHHVLFRNIHFIHSSLKVTLNAPVLTKYCANSLFSPREYHHANGHCTSRMHFV